MNKSTATEYRLRLNNFDYFVSKEYKMGTDDLINKIVEGSKDPYDVLSDYIVYLQYNSNISPLTLKHRVVTAKNFFEYHDIDISPRRFKLKVKLPRLVKKEKEALSKEDIIEILNSCSEIRLKTYVMLLAAGGFRAVEALSIRVCDIEFDAIPIKVFIRGQYTKTKTDRFVYLTSEVARQLKTWLQYKYRTRRVCHFDKERGSTVTEYRSPIRYNTDLIFSVYKTKSELPNLSFIYNDLSHGFGKTLDRIGKGNKEYRGSNGKHRQITLHSFRRAVKSTISDLGYQDYSEWFIGHSGSTYYSKKESEKAQLFLKIEPYLTYLDIASLEAMGADIETKLTEKEKEIQMLRQRDQMKDEALTQLSDRLEEVMEKVQQLEIGYEKRQ